MKLKRLEKIVLILFVFAIFIFMPKISYAGYQELKSLDFEAEIRETGDVRITERWEVYIEETNTLFKTFIDNGRFSRISDVEVKEYTTSGAVFPFKQTSSYKYHVNEDYYHALTNEDGLFEIAWGVAEDNSYDTRIFTIEYTVKDCINVYKDCAEFYWQFLGNEFEIPSEKITGTITLPAVEDVEHLRVWAHGPLNGNIEKVSNSKVMFNVTDMPINTMLEVRIVTPKDKFNVTKSKEYDEYKQDAIIAEEVEWANEANHKREIAAKRRRIIGLCMDVLMGTLSAIYLVNIFKNLKKLFKTKKLKPTEEIQYFRDIPDPYASAADGAYMYFYENGKASNFTSNILSGTFMNLALKGWIVFEVVRGTLKDTLKVKVNKNGKVALTDDENVIYEFLLNYVGKIDGEFTMKEFRNYCVKYNTKFEEVVSKFTKAYEDNAIKNEKVDEHRASTKTYRGLIAMLYSFASFLLMIFAMPLGLRSFMISLLMMALAVCNTVILSLINVKTTGLTQKGVDEKSHWVGLKKYMEDFSLLKEKEVPDLVLWEKFLVFATAFGISKKVIKQLKIIYPELANEDLTNSRYAYMHVICNSSVNFNFVDTISSSISTATNYSSGDGSGGGFSGGGGGGRRWWRRRRPLIKNVLNKPYIFLCKVYFFVHIMY